MKLKKLHIFTQRGSTYTFLNVSNFSTNESVITFDFDAQSDGNPKKGVFFVRCVAGYTLMPAE